MLIEQQPGGLIAPGSLLTLEDGNPMPDEGRSDSADMQQMIKDDKEEPRMTAQPHDLERTAMTASEARSDSVMTYLAIEALQRLSPEQIPDFMKALAVLSQG